MDDELSRMSDGDGEYMESAVIDGAKIEELATTARRDNIRSPLTKTRSLSDGGGTPALSPSPHIFESSSARPQSKDDIGIRDKDHMERGTPPVPSTPTRAGFPIRGLALQLPRRDPTSPAQQSTSSASGSSNIRDAPLSPKLDHSHIYASPTNILPRRSRGLDFSRAATSLHHSTLANQASPDSSPTIGSRAMNIPGRRNGEYANAEQSTSSLWTVMGNHERLHISSSLGSNNHMASSSSSSDDDDDLMDEDMDEAYVTTPQAPRMSTPSSAHPMHSAPWMPSGLLAVNSPLSFQQRQRQRKQPKKKLRTLLGLGFNSTAAAANSNMSKSPPGNMVGKDMSNAHARRESISWAANQLHISGSESDENLKRQHDGVDSPSRPGVIRRAVTRRGSLLPKTKGFARIRAALAEESAPVETEVRREAEVVRQVLESDMNLEPRPHTAHSVTTTALSSPNLTSHDNLDEGSEDAMMVDGLGLAGPTTTSSTFNQQVIKNSKGKVFWDTFSESSNNSASRTTPPPPSYLNLPRGSSSGLSLEDINMDSPSASSNGTSSQNPFLFPIGGGGNATATTTSSSGNGTPQPHNASQGSGSGSGGGGAVSGAAGGGPPSAAEITRRINSKRRRDDDFDPVSFKRRAVSPGMSVHNSPIMQSPLQRDMAPWGSRPGSVGGDTVAAAAAAAAANSNNAMRPGSGAPSENGSLSNGHQQQQQQQQNRVIAIPSGNLKRIGFQGMVDTNDGITRLSIE
ncbi:hypothetical protein B0H66DRAFT_294129 [Apodospora peruviana]|uniref:Uncharacterized protein n=1 Tax=Apodospora peruviana TaxID=516989 RepID=A0AAE0M2A8_9PEZI|nr:hypothetical protein B0H66DRAFT_294129 [Apodospora peruviana]